MGLLSIDKTRCKQDGLCAADCPTAVIRIKAKESYPELVPGADQMCLRCGHCVAVCPHGALSHAEVPLAECVPIRKELSVTPAQALQFLRSRRAVRRFTDQAVQKETLQELIEIARYAPTASNAQLVEWIVINDREQIHAIAEKVIGWMRQVIAKGTQLTSSAYLPRLVAAWDMGVDTVLRGAPGLIVAAAPKESQNGLVDLTLALSYLELAAPGLGLGTCWAGLLQGALLSNRELKRAVGIPEDYPHHYAMMIGTPRVKYYRLPERKQPKITWR